MVGERTVKLRRALPIAKKTSKNKNREDAEKKPAESPSKKSTSKTSLKGKRSKPDETEKIIKKKRTRDNKKDSGRKNKA